MPGQCAHGHGVRRPAHHALLPQRRPEAGGHQAECRQRVRCVEPDIGREARGDTRGDERVPPYRVARLLDRDPRPAVQVPSIEDSLRRLRTDRLDIVWVHDVAQDFHGDEWPAVYESAPHRRLQGPAAPAPHGGRPGRRPRRRGPYSSGILAGGTHFAYQDAPAHIIKKVTRVKELAERHGVSVKAAALRFSLAHPAAAAVIPGATRPSRIAQDVAALEETVPAAFWSELRDAGLVSLWPPCDRSLRGNA